MAPTPQIHSSTGSGGTSTWYEPDAPAPTQQQHESESEPTKVRRQGSESCWTLSPLELFPLSPALRKSAKAQINKASRGTAAWWDLASSGEPKALRVGRLCFLESAPSAERPRWPQTFQEKKNKWCVKSFCLRHFPFPLAFRKLRTPKKTEIKK